MNATDGSSARPLQAELTGHLKVVLKDRAASTPEGSERTVYLLMTLVERAYEAHLNPYEVIGHVLERHYATPAASVEIVSIDEGRLNSADGVDITQQLLDQARDEAAAADAPPVPQQQRYRH